MKFLEKRLAELRAREEEARAGGGPEAVARQHAAGKLTARERVAAVLDEGSFMELDMLVTYRCGDFGLDRQVYPGDGVITGLGRLDGRRVALYAQDFTVLGGSLGEMHARKICKVMDLGVELGIPIIGLIDSGGARVQEGLGHYGAVFYRNVRASGVVPQVSVILGPCAGGAVYSPALSDFVLMVEGISRMFITGPQVLRAVTGQEVTPEELGGARVHNRVSGVAHFLFPDEQSCFAGLRRLLGFLPSNNRERPPATAVNDDRERPVPEVAETLPDDPAEAYDMRRIVRAVADGGDFLEVQEHFAPNIITGFGRLGGRVAGVIANQPLHLGGCLDIDAATKAARFIMFCNAFRLPIVTFVDCPGYLPGLSQEHGGIIRHGAKMLYAYASATVPRITVIVRKLYGGAMSGMSASRYMGTDLTLALPGAEIAIMGPEAAASVIFRDDIAQADDPAARKREKVKEYREKFATPFVAAAQGWLDAIVAPADVRRFVVRALDDLAGKEKGPAGKWHGVIPL